MNLNIHRAESLKPRKKFSTVAAPKALKPSFKSRVILVRGEEATHIVKHGEALRYE